LQLHIMVESCAMFRMDLLFSFGYLCMQKSVQWEDSVLVAQLMILRDIPNHEKTY
jgi:hypothetical protein